MADNSNLASRHPSALPRGYALGNYIIGEVLGTGGFAITYAADHKLMQNKKSVAIKEYLPSEFAHRDMQSSVTPNSRSEQEVFEWGLNRFVDEANILHDLSEVQHPNIVAVQDIFEENSTAYIVMDWVPGKTLSECIKSGMQFSQKDIIDLMSQLLDALEFVHKQDAIHRDISPSNIIIKPNGEPVLIDFGAARAEVREQVPHSQLFKPGYSPIEQEAGSEQDMRADIYSLAATIYHAALGVKPMRASQRQIGINEKQKDPLVPAVELGKKKFSEPFLRALDAGLAVMRDDRPANIVAWRAIFDAAPTLSRWEQLQLQAQDMLEKLRTRAPDLSRRQIRQVQIGVAAMAALLVVSIVVVSLIPDYEDYIAKARLALERGAGDVTKREEAKAALTSALAERENDVAAASGLLGLENLEAFIELLDTGQVQEAGALLTRVEAQLAGLDVDRDLLVPFARQLSAVTSLVEIRDMLVLFRLSDAQTQLAVIDRANLPPRKVDNLQSALGLLQEVRPLLDEGELESAITAVDNAEGFVNNLGMGGFEIEPARQAVQAAIAPWLTQNLEAARELLSADPLKFTAVGEASTRFSRMARMAPDGEEAARGTLLVGALNEIRSSAERGEVADADLRHAYELADSLGFSSTFPNQLRGAVAKIQIGNNLYGVSDGLLAKALLELETLPLSTTVLSKLEEDFSRFAARKAEYSGDDAEVVTGGSAVIEHIMAAWRVLEQQKRYRGAVLALNSARKLLPEIPAPAQAPFSAVINKVSALILGQTDINGQIADVLRVLKDDPGDKNAIEESERALGLLLEEYSDEPKATALLEAIGYLGDAVEAAESCEDHKIQGLLENARKGWIDSIDTEIIDLTRLSLRGRCVPSLSQTGD